MAIRWFDRKFDFSFGMERYDGFYDRLQNTARLFRQAVLMVPDTLLAYKPANKWSMKEHLGHLTLLEPLWRKRFQEISDGQPLLHPADLNNRATDKASFNQMPLPDLQQRFEEERSQTLHFLDNLSPRHFVNTSLHPRLQTPMRIVDLMYFVTEHDDHHLAVVRHIIKETLNA